MSGISLTVVALLMSTQLHAGASYLQIFVSLVLLGAGLGDRAGALDASRAVRRRAR